jgi:hypothetical protein
MIDYDHAQTTLTWNHCTTFAITVAPMTVAPNLKSAVLAVLGLLEQRTTLYCNCQTSQHHYTNTALLLPDKTYPSHSSLSCCCCFCCWHSIAAASYNTICRLSPCWRCCRRGLHSGRCCLAAAAAGTVLFALHCNTHLHASSSLSWCCCC